MAKKYNRPKKRKKKKNPYNRKIVKMRRTRNVVFLIIIMVSVILMSRLFSNEDLNITKDNINYYIDIADKYSEGKKQLNWKEIAAIDGGLNENNFQKSNEDVIKMIADSFYEEGSINKVSFTDALDKCTSLKKSKVKANTNLIKLENISLRNMTYGEDSSKDSFINKIKEYAIDNYNNYGILPSVTISQAIIESNWGNSELSSQYNNYFGIKASNGWKGRIVNFSTKENYKDVINANFRAYDSIKDSVNDQGMFLYQNSRYRDNGLFSTTS